MANERAAENEAVSIKYTKEFLNDKSLWRENE